MIWRRQLEAESFNQELFDEILRRAQLGPSHSSHNQGGWRSDSDLLAWPLPAVTVLYGLVRAAFDEVSGKRDRYKRWRAWALVNRDGSHHNRHTHLGDWTGIYYVTSGSGDTIFEIPGGIERVTPSAGLLVIAPSKVYHSVEPCVASSPRVTIAFEAR